MKLLFDIGNTNTKWRIDNGSRGQFASRDWQRAFDEHRQRWKSVTGIGVSSVAHPEASEAFIRRLQDELAPVFVAKTSASALGVTCAYAEPKALGVDRWLAMLAAWQEFRSDLVIVDAGSAMTLDVIDASGQHRGGLITAGIEMSRAALLRDTGRIPLSDIGEIAWLTNNTRDAVSAGPTLSAASLASGLLDHLGETLSPKLVVTGGDAARIVPWLKHPAELRPDLVLDGLGLLMEDSCAT